VIIGVDQIADSALPVDGGFAMGAVRRTTRSGAASCCHCWGYHAVRGAVARSRVGVRRWGPRTGPLGRAWTRIVLSS